MSPFFMPPDTRVPAKPRTVPSCPVCGGPLVEMRGANRCGRCQYIFCQSCEGECPEPVEGDRGEW
jgi:hypothetical protein